MSNRGGGPGTPCSNNEECEEGLGCVLGPNLTHICGDAAAVGVACNNADGCRIGQYCSGMCFPMARTGDACSVCNRSNRCNSTSTCEPLAKIGETCRSGGVCDYDAYCDGMSCKALKPDGAPCSAPIECASGSCDPSSTCSTPGLCF